MVSGNVKWIGLAIASALAFAACEGSSLKAGRRNDSGTNPPDIAPERDLALDNRPISKDAAADADIVPREVGPDAPLLDRDSAIPDTALPKQDTAPKQDATPDGGGAPACTPKLTKPATVPQNDPLMRLGLRG